VCPAGDDGASWAGKSEDEAGAGGKAGSAGDCAGVDETGSTEPVGSNARPAPTRSVGSDAGVTVECAGAAWTRSRANCTAPAAGRLGDVTDGRGADDETDEAATAAEERAARVVVAMTVGAADAVIGAAVFGFGPAVVTAGATTGTTVFVIGAATFTTGATVFVIGTIGATVFTTGATTGATVFVIGATTFATGATTGAAVSTVGATTFATGATTGAAVSTTGATTFAADSTAGAACVTGGPTSATARPAGVAADRFRTARLPRRRRRFRDRCNRVCHRRGDRAHGWSERECTGRPRVASADGERSCHAADSDEK
jgi:hypothetical protein